MPRSYYRIIHPASAPKSRSRAIRSTSGTHPPLHGISGVHPPLRPPTFPRAAQSPLRSLPNPPSRLRNSPPIPLPYQRQLLLGSLQYTPSPQSCCSRFPMPCCPRPFTLASVPVLLNTAAVPALPTFTSTPFTSAAAFQVPVAASAPTPGGAPALATAPVSVGAPAPVRAAAPTSAVLLSLLPLATPTPAAASIQPSSGSELPHSGPPAHASCMTSSTDIAVPQVPPCGQVLPCAPPQPYKPAATPSQAPSACSKKQRVLRIHSDSSSEDSSSSSSTSDSDEVDSWAKTKCKPLRQVNGNKPKKLQLFL